MNNLSSKGLALTFVNFKRIYSEKTKKQMFFTTDLLRILGKVEPFRYSNTKNE